MDDADCEGRFVGNFYLIPEGKGTAVAAESVGADLAAHLFVAHAEDELQLVRIGIGLSRADEVAVDLHDVVAIVELGLVDFSFAGH